MPVTFKKHARRTGNNNLKTKKMKKIAMICMMVGIFYQLSAFSNESFTVAVPDTISNPNDESDTTRIVIGKKEVNIFESEDGTTVDIKKRSDEEDEDEMEFDEESEPRKKKFTGHWDSFGIGMANFMDADYSMSRTPETNFMDLNTGKSTNININAFQQGFGLGTNHVGIVTGLGLEINDYFFDNNNSIIKNSETGVIEEYDYDLLGVNLNKSKLVTTYLVLPLLIEFNFGKNSNPYDRFYISGGVIGGVKLGSKTKVVYKEDGNKEKRKNKDDFNINPLKYGLTLRAGYKDFQVYTNYFLTPFFEDNKGPELYAFSIGVAFNID